MASISYDPGSVPLARDAPAVVACRYDPKKVKFSPLPNVVPVSIRYAEGADPGSARFRYQFSQLLPPQFPSHVEDVAGLDKQGPFVIKQDDRVAVLLMAPDGESWTVLFDGYAQVPQVDLSREHESATFQALGKAIRCWDTPLGGAIHRNAPDPTVVDDTPTDRPARFNPDGRKNRVPDDAFAGEDDDTKYPTFLDPALVKALKKGEYWSVADAATYILAVGNDGKYVQNPSFAKLKKWLSARVPAKEDKDVHDDDPPDEPPEDAEADALDELELDDPEPEGDEEEGDQEAEDQEDDDPDEEADRRIICQDLDVRGDPWPVALEKLLRPHNFGFCFRLDQLPSGRPYAWLDFYRLDDADGAPTTTARLQAVGSQLDPSRSNVAALSIERDGAGIANQIVVDTECIRRECALTLVPLFDVAAADANDGNDAKFNLGNPGFVEANRDKYRVYGFDETGEGHWDFPTTSKKTTIASLDDVLGKPDDDPVTKKKAPRYAKRRRPALASLFTTRNGRRLRAQLHVSKAYNQPIPGVWDGSADDWQPVVGGWELLDDRLGIRITESNITDWKVGSKDVRNPAKYPAPAGAFNLVKSQNNPVTDKANPRVYFRLTCVLEGDRGIDVAAKRRPGTITPFTITRRVDCIDRFVWHAVDKSSPHYVKDQFDDYEIDYEEATHYAEAMRAAHENATFKGRIVVPRITAAYRVGDKVKKIEGRDIDLRTNGGAAQKVAGQYPVVTSVTWSFDGQHSTELELSERRAEPADERTRGYRRR